MSTLRGQWEWVSPGDQLQTWEPSMDSACKPGSWSVYMWQRLVRDGGSTSEQRAPCDSQGSSAVIQPLDVCLTTSLQDRIRAMWEGWMSPGTGVGAGGQRCMWTWLESALFARLVGASVWRGRHRPAAVLSTDTQMERPRASRADCHMLHGGIWWT